MLSSFLTPGLTLFFKSRAFVSLQQMAEIGRKNNSQMPIFLDLDDDNCILGKYKFLVLPSQSNFSGNTVMLLARDRLSL